MSQFLSSPVELLLSRKQNSDPNLRIAEDADRLSKLGTIEAQLRIHDAASDLNIAADLRSRSIRVSMELEAPREKKRTSSRVSWLLRQLKDVEPNEIRLRLKWASRAPDSDLALSDVVENPKMCDDLQPQSELRAIEIMMGSSSGQRFRGRQAFIQELEQLCPSFYGKIGQRLRAWQPSPPKPKDRREEPSGTDKTSREKATSLTAGNDHTDLLEVPEFLRRLEVIASENSEKSRDESHGHRQASRFQPHLVKRSSN